MLSSLPSSHRAVTETIADPSETVALQVGEKLLVVSSRPVIGFVCLSSIFMIFWRLMTRIFERAIAGSLFWPLGEKAIYDIIRAVIAGAHFVTYTLVFMWFPKAYRRNKHTIVSGASVICVVRIFVVVLIILILLVLIYGFLDKCSTNHECVSLREHLCVTVKVWKVFL